MKKRITKSQFGKLVESQVRNLLKESNYDDYEYFFGDGTGGRTANPYPYGTELGDADNWEELEKQKQIESDWNGLGNINKKYKAEKFSPILAKDYNHNVEDGREGAEDYCHGLEEKILKQVKKALSEEVNYDYDGKWEEYVRNEVHNLYELEEKVPYSYRSAIHSAMTELEAILDAQKRNREFDNWNN